MFSFSDELGPAKIVHLTERRTGLRAIVVIDNVAAGPAIGGLRMSTEVTTEICVRLARAMTLKNAMAGLPHGGAKSGILADPKMDVADKEALVRAFADAIKDLKDYVPGPDMGTNETAMAWILDEIGRAVGLPSALGGLPLDQLGTTGYGVAVATEVAAKRMALDLDGARIVVQGYGNVGRPAARFLAERGCVLVAVADSRGAITEPQGLDLDTLDELKAAHASVIDHPGRPLGHEELVGVDCDIWIPAAGPDVLRLDNVDRLQADLVVQGANIPATPAAEDSLHGRGVVCIPDFVANAGGVICGAIEYAGGTRRQAFETIDEQIRSNTDMVLERAANQEESPRQSALAIVGDRVRAAMTTRRWC
ncbi:MAG: Glu/Leu/Phe/Val dehydrogenase [Actinomycetia bacterium]|nr:Glu/Leu/Phe/Val dehydrogenase [Actinomycetes bacterium]